MFTVKVKDKKIEFENKVTLKDLAKELNINAYVATVNNRLRELDYYINYNAEVVFLDLDNYDATRVYETSMRYIIIKALSKINPSLKVKFLESISRSTAIEINGADVDEDFLEILKKEIDNIIKQDLPITRKRLSKEDAIELYEKEGYLDKIEVLKYREENYVNAYICEDYVNYMFGYMVPSTGYLKEYKLQLYYPYILMQLPRAEEGGRIPEFEDSPSFGRMQKEARDWAKMINSDTISHLNQQIEADGGFELVNMCESKHNNMLSDLGQKIKNDVNNIRLIAIAGPSSSGKTTFSNRLRIELMVRGIRPIKISIDDYYMPRAFAPLDEFGNPDLEHIEALDIELFNRDILSLIKGEEITLPRFDFKSGTRLEGKKIKVSKDTPIIIEGIHALNERLTRSIPKHQKFKIYISPTIQINIDNHNPINATDVRMLRRIVRDWQFRKTTPEDTLAMWASVRRGEFKWIYPFQEEADYIFNTELTYELGIMKKYALPILEKIDRNSEFFIPANRLVKFLKYFKDISDAAVPCNSLLREFIGDSCFLEVH